MDNLKTFYIFGLLIVSLLLWDAWQKDYVRPQQPSQSSQGESAVPAEHKKAEKQDLPDMPVSTKAEEVPAKTAGSELVSAETVHVKTDLMEIEISPMGADIHRLALLKYPVEADKPDEPVQLLSESDQHFLLFSLVCVQTG